MTPFDIFIIYLTWENGGKSRPVLAFTADGNSVDIYQITTRYENKSEEIRVLYFKSSTEHRRGLISSRMSIPAL